jgi:hypothetical protein
MEQSINLRNCLIDKITSMKDKSLKITLITRELPPIEMANIFLHLNQEILSVQVPLEESEGKSKSQRLRACLYRLWEQEYK